MVYGIIMDKPIAPILVACLGIALFSVMDAYMKKLSIALGAYNAIQWRLWLGAVLGGILFFAMRQPLPGAHSRWVHFKRGGIAAFMAMSFFYGIARVPLAEGIALSFIAPLITLYLAAVLLGEVVTRQSIIASLLGLAGVAVMLLDRWQVQTHDPEAIWGIAAILLSAVLYAYNLILQRQQAQISGPLEIVFFQNLIAGTVIFAAFIIAYVAAPMIGLTPVPLVVPGPEHWPDLLMASLLTMGALGLLAWAYKRAEAQKLVAIEYTAFLWAAVFGWLFFEEKVTIATLIGTALIITGCIIATRQKSSGQGETSMA
jgi:S-adenosylmethionine uptake transporter